MSYEYATDPDPHFDLFQPDRPVEIENRVRHETGTRVVVFRRRTTWEDPVKWWTVCEGRDGDCTHASIVGYSTRKMAMLRARTPLMWCSVCQEERDDMRKVCAV